MNPQRGPRPEEIVELLLRLVGRVRDELERQAADLRLSSRQAMALLHLDQPLPMRELATLMRCDPSYVTALADRLEDMGLVERTAGAGDRRVKRLVLTAQGRAVRVHLYEVLCSGECFVSALGGPERQVLGELLGRMLSQGPPLTEV